MFLLYIHTSISSQAVTLRFSIISAILRKSSCHGLIVLESFPPPLIERSPVAELGARTSTNTQGARSGYYSTLCNSDNQVATTMASPQQTILVASQNPVKIAAALAGFQAMFPNIIFEAKGVDVPSGVPEQPFSDAETLEGALNRARNARETQAQADYWIGIEGGVDDTIEQTAGTLQSFAWVVIVDQEGKTGKARTMSYYQPEEIARLVRGGMELGHADDQVFGRTNSKQANGNVGLLTGDVVTRETYYVQAVIGALIPFRNRGLTF